MPGRESQSVASEKIPFSQWQPAAPANLKAYAVISTTGNYVKLIWDNIPNNEANYEIQRSSNDTFTANDTITFSPNNPEDVTAFNDTTVDFSHDNYYRVRTVNSAGASSYIQAHVLPVGSTPSGDPNAVKPQQEITHTTDDTAHSTDPVRYSDGLLSLESTDLSSDQMGGWSWGRSWAASSAYAVGGTNGNRWMDTSLSWLRVNDNGSIYVVTGGQDSHSYQLVGVNYVADDYVLDTLTHDSGTHLFTLKATDGSVQRFYDFDDANPGALKGRLKDYTDAAGNTTTAIYNSTSARLDRLDRAPAGGSVTEQFEFTYVPDTDPVNAGLIASVTLKRSGSTFRSVSYTYYDGTTSGGNARDLALVTIKDGAGTILDNKYYRYYTAGQTGGYNGYLKYSLGTSQYAALVRAAGGTYSGVTAASDSLVAQYADIGVTYDTNGRVLTEAIRSFGDSTQSDGIGTEKFEYLSSTNADGYNSWKTKTTEYLPDNTPTDWLDNDQNIVYTNAYGQAMLKLTVDRNGTDSTSDDKTYADFYAFDEKGHTVLHANPSAVTVSEDAIDSIENYSDLLNKESNGHYQYLSDNSGLIETSVFETTSTTATATTAGNVIGYLKSTAIQNGELRASVPQSSYQYYNYTANGSTVNPIASTTVYAETNGTGARTTTYTYGWYGDDTTTQADDKAQIKWQATSLPIVANGTTPAGRPNENGSGTADVSVIYYDTFGRVIWTKDATGHVNKTVYDSATGGIIQTIEDANSATLSGNLTLLNSAGVTAVNNGLNLVTAYEVDAKGRQTKATDPNNNITYTVYNDAAHEVRTYAGWTGTTTTGPITITREIRNATPDSHGIGSRFTETITSSATPTVSNGKPTGQEVIDSSNILSLSRSLMNAAGQVVETDDYFSIPTTYSTTTPRLEATEGANKSNDSTTGAYHATYYGYDGRGRQSWVKDATGTITRYVYDALDRLVSTWVGTIDTPSWSPTNTAGSNLVKVSENEYDNGGVGDSNLTKTTTYPGISATPRVTKNYYDWRDRLVATKSAVQTSEQPTDNTHFINYVDYDNLGEVTASYIYDGDNVTITDGDNNGVPDQPAGSLLRAKSIAKYDAQGRVYESTTVDTSAGSNTATAGLTSKTWYDKRGYVIKTSAPGGLVSKSTYDGVGRITNVYTSDGGGDSSWSDADDVLGDTVLEQVDYTYDADGNVIQTATRQRMDNATGTGALGDAKSTSQPTARVYYAGSYYDALNRDIADVSVGTNVTSTSGVSAWTRPSPNPPTRSDDVLVTSYFYNSTTGYLETTTDAKGIVSKNYYDALGRTTRTVAAYTNGTPTDNTNQTTDYTYDGSGHVLTMTAVLSGSAHQTTQYKYGVSQTNSAIGLSDIDSNDILSATYYPDKTTGNASSSSAELQTVNALGQVKTSTDRNATTHTFAYDVLGRLSSDTVTTPGSTIDTSIKRLGYTYDSAGRAYQFTSYSDLAGTTVVNQVQRQYNGLGQLVTEYQEHSGAVNTSTSAKTQYSYNLMAGGSNNSRITSMTYPNGRVINYNYNGTTLDNSISRLSSLSDSSGTLEGYTYLGLGTVVARSHPQPGVDQTYISTAGQNNAYNASDVTKWGGDRYTGLDEFGRVVDQYWVKSGTTAVDEYTYSYDRNSNRTVKENKVSSTNSEVYSYDSLDRLIESRRGTLDSAKTGISGTPTASQSWDLDSVGNWDSLTSNSSGTSTQTAPTAPTGLAAAASGQGRINLTWADISNNESSFVIERSTSSGGTYSVIGYAAPNATGYADTALPAATTYYYRIASVNTGGNLSYTSVASATTASNAGSPSLSSSVTNVVTNTNDTVNLTTEGTADWIQWDSLTSTNRKSTGGSQFGNYSISSGGTNSNQTGAPMKVSWSDGSPTTSSSNDQDGFKEEGLAISGSNRWISFTAVADTQQRTVKIYAFGYYSDINLGATLSDGSATAISYNDSGAGGLYGRIYTVTYRAASAGQTITFKLTNRNGMDWGQVGLQAATMAITGTGGGSTPSAPSSASGFSATAASSKQINLAWTDASSNEDGFVIQRKLSSSSTWTQVAITAANATSYSDASSSLIAGTSYDYSVISFNAGGNATATATATATTSTTLIAPSIPHAAAASSGQINLDWADNSNNETAFKIERSTSSGGTYSVIGYTANGATTYSDVGLSAGTTYYYRISAINDSSSSSTTAVVSATTQTLSSPGITTGTPTIGLTSATISSGTDYWILWNSTSSTITKSGVTNPFGTLTPSSGSLVNEGNDGLSMTWTGGTPTTSGTNTNSVKMESAQGKSISFTVPADTTSRTLTIYVFGWYANPRLTVTLSDNSATQDVVRDGGSGDPKVVTAFTVTYAAASADQTATITISQPSNNGYSFGQIGLIGASLVVNGSTGGGSQPAAPSAPTSLTATATSSSQVNLAWTDNANNESGYVIQRKLSSSSTWAQVFTTAANVTSYSDITALSAGTGYDYRVIAINAGGSNYSNSASATTQGGTTGSGSTSNTDDRTYNAQNELTQTNGSTLTYDANGNMTTDQNGNTLVYDAWNHLKQMKTGSTVIATYSFDALGRRITDNTGTANELYYSGSQIIEERQAGVTKVQNVWSPIYINALIERDRDTDGNGTLDERLYAIQDANYNTTALVNTAGTVVERFQYDPYGHVTVLNANWSTNAATAGNDTYKWTTLFQGMRYDPRVDLTFSLTRPYSAELGRWIGQDWKRYIDGANLYQMVLGNPIYGVDPSGYQTATSQPTSQPTTRQASESEDIDPRLPIYVKEDWIIHDNDDLRFNAYGSTSPIIDDFKVKIEDCQNGCGKKYFIKVIKIDWHIEVNILSGTAISKKTGGKWDPDKYKDTTGWSNAKFYHSAGGGFLDFDSARDHEYEHVKQYRKVGNAALKEFIKKFESDNQSNFKDLLEGTETSINHGDRNHGWGRPRIVIMDALQNEYKPGPGFDAWEGGEDEATTVARKTLNGKL